MHPPSTFLNSPVVGPQLGLKAWDGGRDATLEDVIWSGKKRGTTQGGSERRHRLLLSGHLSVVECAAISLALSGCASPGFPRPPSLHLPEAVTDLSARRIADRVELSWTGPTTTTDGLPVTFPTTVEICRGDPGKPPPAGTTDLPCTAVRKVAGASGPSSAFDRLPPGLTDAQASGQFLAYRVRVLNPAGRAAIPISTALVPAGPSPSSVEDFHATQRSDGVLLKWRESSPPSKAAVEVVRSDLTPKPTPSTLQPGTPPNDRPKAPGPSAARRKTDSSEVRLGAEVDDASPATFTSRPAALSPQGMIDQTAAPDRTYSYRAQRVLTIHQGGKTYELLSEPTLPITVAMRDTFPPAVPRGLVSIPGRTGPSAGRGSRPTIDLSWEPNTEADLAGYFVYRTEVTGAAGSTADRPSRLTALPLPGPAFRDETVLPGRRYVYRVTSLDRDGNESVPSSPTVDSPDGR